MMVNKKINSHDREEKTRPTVNRRKTLTRSTQRDQVRSEEELIPVTDIAEEMGISPKTARSKLRRQLGKRHRWAFSRREVPSIKRLIR